MKTKLLLFLLIIMGQNVFSQKSDYVGHVTLLKKNGETKAMSTVPTSNYVGHVTLLRYTQIYFGAGLITPNSTTTEGINSVKGSDINLSLYKPIWAWDKSKISLGFNAGGAYTSGNGDYDFTNQYTVYNLKGQSQEPTVSENATGGPKNTGFRGGGGLQMNVHFGKITLSPLFNAEYLSMKQKSFTSSETLYYNGSEYTYNLFSQKETKISGLGIIPKFRITYNITPRLGLWLEGNYILGPSVKTETTRFTIDPSVPLDNINLGNFEEGKYITTEKETKYKAVGVIGGIVLNIGKPNKGKPIKENGTPTMEINSSNNNDCIEYSAPEILGSNQNKNIQLDKKNLNILFKPSNAVAVNYKVLVWKEKKGKKELIHDAIYPSNFNGSIKDLKLDSDKSEELTVQIKAIPPRKESTKPLNNNKAAFQKSFCSTFTNNGESNVANYFVSNDTPCSPTYTKEITKVECIENGKIKVSGTYSITLPPGKTGSLSIDSWNVLVDGVATTISNPTATITPLPITVTSGTIYNFSFEIEGGDACNKSLDILYNMHYVINCGTFVMESNIPCLMSYESLPCCYCNYCDKPENMNIINTSQSTTVASNNLGISQQMNVTPKNISKITAEIVSIKESEVDEACKTCRKNQQGQLMENEVYHFVGNNTATWSLGTPLAASSANSGTTFPTKLLEWKTNDKGAIDFNLNIALPGTAALSCCERHGVVCVRYSFTDIECKTCSILVCYQY